MQSKLGLWAFLSLLWLLTLTVSAETTPTTTPSPTPPTPVASPESQRLYAEAIGLMNQTDMDGSLKKLDELLALEPNNLAALNLRGAVMVRKLNYEGAEASFSRILAIDPKNGIGLFNLAEVAFLRKDYAKAKGYFSQFMQVGGNEQNALGRYKIFLCDLLGYDTAPAMATLKSLEPTISNPFYYFAHAAVEFKQNRPDKGREYIKSAFSIFPGGMNAAFADSMVGLGWIKQEEVASIGSIDASALNSLSTEFQPDKSSAPSPSLGFESLLPDFAGGDKKKKPEPDKP